MIGGRIIHREWKLGLLGRFAIVSLVPIVLLGLVLAHFMGAQIRQRAVTDAARSAELVSRLGIQPLLTPTDLSEGLTRSRLDALDAAVRPGLLGGDVTRIKIWNADSQIVYADDGSLIGRTFPTSHELEEALDGKREVEISDLGEAEDATERAYGQALEVYVPITFRADTKPSGAFEIYLPYAPIAAGIAQDTRKLYVLLVGGLLVLYGALFHIVRRARKHEHQALHDDLTDLPNRLLFRDRAEQAVRNARREASGAAVLIVDLDRFKQINDTLGHQRGDLLLQEIARRLRAVLRDTDTIARLGGDEFGIVLRDVREASAAIQVAEKARQAIGLPTLLEGLALEIESSVGVALYPEHGDDVDALIQSADVAMYAAKRRRSGQALYTPEDGFSSPAQLTLLGELRRALDNGELLVYYQPKASLATGVVDSVEALVRWQHPDRGLLLPSEFIPFAEQTAMMRPLTRYVLSAALRRCRSWSDRGWQLGVAVNVSPRDLLDPRFPSEVADLLRAERVSARCLALEVTETGVLSDPGRTQRALAKLKALGVKIAIDDFGSVASSLTQLGNLPADQLKVDRSLIATMEEGNENGTAIVSSIVDLGRRLGLEVVAEGVETQAGWRKLEALGCDAVQGYYLSHPLPAEELEAWLYASGRLSIDSDESLEVSLVI